MRERTTIKLRGTRPHPHGKVYVSVAEAASRLGIIASRVYLLIRSGEFEAVQPKDSRRSYIAAVAVQAYKRRRDAWLRQHGRSRPAPLAHAS